MDSLCNQAVAGRLSVAARIAFLLLIVGGVVACTSVVSLVTILLLATGPLLYRTHALRSYFRFALVVLLPISAALFMVWGLVVKAPPAQAIGSSHVEGRRYAAVVSLRLAVLAGMFQALFHELRGKDALKQLRKWGLSGDLLVITLSTLALIPEGRLRAEQVIVSRLARGLVGRRGWFSTKRQLPVVLRPMLGWILRSAVQRAELWQHRNLLDSFGSAGSCNEPPGMEWPASVAGAASGSEEMTADKQSEIVEAVEHGGATAIVGDNFSGRTEALRELAGLGPYAGERRSRGSAYVGPEPQAAMSGLALTVADELVMNAGENGLRDNSALIEALNLGEFWGRNPNTLSGGEQASLALACAATRYPTRLTIDCAFEQLDCRLRAAFLDWVSRTRTRQLTAIADNRFDEMNANELATFQRTVRIRAQLGTGAERPSMSVPDSGFLYQRQKEPFCIAAKGITFSYSNSRPVLDDLDVELAPGQIYILEGRNGAGKSTFAKLLCGVIRQNAGAFYRNGARYSPWHQPGLDVAYHFQNPDVQLFENSVADEIIAGPKSAGLLPPGPLEQWIAAVVDLFGLADVRTQHPLDLPFVLRKRVAMAATFASGCPWMIFDEPTLGQDAATVTTLVRLFEFLKRNGNGLIVISHSTSFKNQLGSAIRLEAGSGRLTQNATAQSL
jgi:energy-coupling factor transport system ATP-binding protein